MDDSFLTTNQIYIGSVKPVPEALVKVENREYFNKPSGGIWTSSLGYCEDCQMGETGWYCWAKDNMPEMVNNKPWWHLKPNPNAKIYTIDSMQDYINLLERFHCSGEINNHSFKPLISGSSYLDFEKISQYYDAIHLTHNGRRTTEGWPNYDGNYMEMYRKYGLMLYGWDCESTLWLNWCFEEVLQIPGITASKVLESNTV